MSLFLITFFSIYSAMHAYAFFKAKAGLAFSSGFALCLIVFMAFMITAPFAIRMSAKAGYETFAQAMSYIGYTWLVLLFMFVSVSLVLDLYRLSVFLSERIVHRDFSYISIPARFAFYISMIISVIIITYGYFEAKNIRVEKIIIKSSKLPLKTGTLRIVQISDMHLGLIIKEQRLNAVIQKVKDTDPDIFISTGDLVDGYMPKENNLENMLAEINPRYGKFAVTGNHEFYAGIKKAIDFTERAGFKVLRDEAVNVAGIINIAGIDDPTGKTFGLRKNTNEKELLLNLPSENFTLLLKHRPLVDKNAIGLFDLQLSGHVHKGQIFPFTIITWLYYPVNAGFKNLQDNSSLYVSRGTGTWGPPIRFLAPPEITVIEIVSEAS